MSELTDTVARAALALLDLDETIEKVEVRFGSDDHGADQGVVYAWRCPGCNETHAQVVNSRRWSREEADADLYQHPPPGV